MLQKYIFLCVLVISFVNLVYSNGYYTIIGSKQIRPNSDYTASVTLHNHPGSCKIRLSIENNNNYKKSQEIVAQPDETQLVKIPTGNMVSGSSGYRFIAEGTSGIIFRNETMINLNEKSFSVFIQTDKAMYKPGDLVQFRVLLLDENTKPVQLQGDLNVFITDGNSNRIKQWNGIIPVKGVFSEKLQLTEYPVLGNWNINVEYSGEEKQKTFEVAEYVLPKFEVIIDAPKHQLYDDGIVRASISGKYTYGQPVRGEAKVSINYRDSNLQPLLQQTLNIEKKEQIEFKISDLRLRSQYQRDFEIAANFTEELTGRIQTAITYVTLHVDKFKITNVNPSREYKPGLPFDVITKITKYDETPITDSVNKLRISYGPSYQRRTDNVEYFSIENGIVSFDLIVPNNESGIYIYAEYLGKEVSLGYFTKAESRTGVYLQAVVRSGVPKLNNRVLIELESTERMTSFTYQVLGRGNVLASDTVAVRNRNLQTFSFMTTFEMIPKAQVIIFYLKNGEIVSTKLELEFSDEFENQISVSTSVDEAKPRDTVDITVSTTRNSFVGLLGVDQSVLILKSGFDLSQQAVFDDLDEYNKDYARRIIWGGPILIRPLPGRMIMPLPTPIPDVWKDFDAAGAVILSNAIRPVVRRPRRPIVRRGGFGRGIGIARTSSLASPAAMVAPAPAMPLPQAEEPPVVEAPVRKLFPETWIWDEISDNFPGTRTLNKTIPDTITSWIITGFSINPSTGLGMTRSPTKLQVFQPFFISLDLPYSIKRGETAAIKVVVFNYMSNAVNAKVTLHRQNEEFEFAEPSSLRIRPQSNLFRTKTISIRANDGSAVSFLIRPNIIGPLTIKVSADALSAGDSIERVLPVEPEGTPQFINQALFIDLRSQSNYQSTLSVSIPSIAVDNSTRVEFSVIGDIMGTTLTNLENLIRMPYGCGEQNMINFVPNIVVIDYLTSTGQLTSDIESKAKTYMEAGYQRQLGYAHDDGSFSAFGKRDASGSTWLTAYVIRSFTQAKPYISIDSTIIDKALSWLTTIQTNKGSFPEVGRVSSRSMQGGAGQGVALTAYTLIAILETKQNYEAITNKAIAYLLDVVDTSVELYDLALIAYALQLANHTAKNTVYRKFVSRSQQVDDKKWWGNAASSSTASSSIKINSVDVEITSYGLLTTMLAGTVTDGLPIMRWLLSKRSDRGGFESTQDTVVGITALAAFSKFISSRNSNVQLFVRYDGEETRSTVTSSNALIYQQYRLPGTVRRVSVTATGRGFALFELSYRYNINVNEPKPRFKLVPTFTKSSTINHLLISVCGSYIPSASQNVSNMAVMEIELPSGYVADLDQFTEILAMKNIKRVETKNGDTIIVIYFDNFGADEICPIISAYRAHKVANIKPVPVKLYDYYENEQSACTFYQVQQQSVCDICEGGDCGDLC